MIESKIISPELPFGGYFIFSLSKRNSFKKKILSEVTFEIPVK